MDAYMYRAALYCEDDAYKIMDTLPGTAEDADYDSERYPIGPSPNGGGESDSPQHCDTCGVFLENPLTADGIQYVRDEVRDAQGDRSDDRAVLATWIEFYADELARGDGLDLAVEDVNRRFAN